MIFQNTHSIPLLNRTKCDHNISVPARLFTAKAFERWAKGTGVTDAELLQAATEIESGLIDARLGGNVHKKRIARAGRGKADGHRAFVFYMEKDGERMVFESGLSKNDASNISDPELKAKKIAAKVILELTDAQIESETGKGTFREIQR